MTPPLVLWWSWVGVLILSLGDLLVQGHRLFSLKFGFAALAVTGLVYACTLWPVVIADDRGIEVRNPFRRYVIPWLAVRGIYLADSVEVQSARAGGKKDKTIYSWALSSPRRTRARAQLRAWQWDAGKRSRPSSYRRLPQPAQNLVKMTTAEIMARELAALSDDARFRSVVVDVEIDVSIDQPAADGTALDSVADAVVSEDVAVSEEVLLSEAGAPEAAAGQGAVGPADDVLISRWAWPPVLAVVLPAIAYLICVLVK
jgi:PH (Pleckstrin Homology) domain-containing protein